MKCWHYCSNSTFKKIIESHSLWLTDSTAMNDSTECKFIEETVNEYYKEKPKSQFEEIIKQNLSINFDKPRFLACFSMDCDLLSQWCKYADDGRGVAIGFDTEVLDLPDNLLLGGTSDHNLGFSRVIYDKKKQKNYVKNKLDEAEELYSDIQQNPENYVGPQLKVFNYITDLTALSMIFKHPAFAEENECRLIFSPRPTCKPDGYRDTKDRFSPYHIFPFVRQNQQGDLELRKDFVFEVKLGPRNMSKIDDIKNFLVINGYNDTVVNKSIIPYRG